LTNLYLNLKFEICTAGTQAPNCITKLCNISDYQFLFLASLATHTAPF